MEIGHGNVSKIGTLWTVTESHPRGGMELRWLTHWEYVVEPRWPASWEYVMEPLAVDNHKLS